MAALEFFCDGRKYEINYDQYGDVLYVISPESRRATRTEDGGDGIQWRFQGDDLQVAGFTIFDFNYCWEKRIPELYKHVLEHLRNNTDLAEKIMHGIYEASRGGVKSVDESFERLGIGRIEKR